MTDDNQMQADWDVLQTPATSLAAELKTLRETCPVPFGHLPGRFDYWSLTRYDDVVAAARDTATFANSTARFARRRVPLESDPPEHSQIRRLMQPFFLPSVLARLEPVSKQYATELLDVALAADHCDAVESLARPLPPQVLLKLMGQPREDWKRIKELSEMGYLQTSSSTADQQRFNEADVELWNYSESVVADRQREPRNTDDDLLSAMLAASIDGAPIDPQLVVGMVRLLLAAGHDSTTSSLGICLHHLARNAEHQTLLRANPALIPKAIEEILRFESPVVMMPRTVTADTEIRGRQLRKGDRLMLNWASANRDESTFEAPDECRLDRTPNRHVVFGHGIHTCIGAALARQEIRVMLEELLRRTGSFSLAGPVSYHLWHRFAPAELPIRIQPIRIESARTP